MIYTRGNIREHLLGAGIKFNPSTMYMLANDYNYEEEKIADKEEVGNDGDKEPEEVREKVVKEEVEKEKNVSIYNMKAVARKMLTPGCAHYDSGEEED